MNVRLQSMRGLAALMVALGHSFQIFPVGAAWVTGDYPGFAADPRLAWLLAFQPVGAVVFFYVLSGYVLGLSLQRHGEDVRPRNMLGFAVRRLGRLVPVMWLSIVISAAILLVIARPPIPGVTPELNDAFFRGPHRLLLNLLGYDYSINGVLWSIQVELVMIPLLPVMERLSRGRGVFWDVALLAGLVALSSGRVWFDSPLPVRYFYCFQIGVMLPKLMALPLCRVRLQRGPVAALAILLLVPLKYLLITGLISGANYERGVTVAAAVLIAHVVLKPGSRVAGTLDARGLRWLGDHSYSFYAFHFTAVALCAGIFVGRVPPAAYASTGGATAIMAAVAAASVAVALALAAVTYPALEKPMIAGSRALAVRIERWGKEVRNLSV